MNPHADPRESCCTKNADNQRLRRAHRGRREEKNDQRHARCKTRGVVERESAQQVAWREVPGVVECKSAQQMVAREELASGRREEGNDQHRARRKTPGVVECESAQSYQLTRLQFPLRLAYAMTYNKSQSQTLFRVLLDITLPPFSNGQLYVALS
jgi:hypothetical protein